MKTSKYPSIEECISQLWYTHTIEYYSSVKKLREHAITTMNIQIHHVKLKKLATKSTYCMIIFR